jgi:hypothetical protein
VENAFLERADARQTFFLYPLPQPSPNGRISVRAEVKPVVPEDSLQQQLDLDSLEIGLERVALGL